MDSSTLTIGRLAKAAAVGIETIRYYQRRKLLPTPVAPQGTVRRYPLGLVDRIRFIRRAQELGFTLKEISGLLKLADGLDRRAIRRLAGSRLENIRGKIDDLRRMEAALSQLLRQCASTGSAKPCPIIEALGSNESERQSRSAH